MEICKTLLLKIYGNTHWQKLWDYWYPKWCQMSEEAHATASQNSNVRNEQLSLLITYGDSLKYKTLKNDTDNDAHTNEEETPLATLYRFLDVMCDHEITGVHILPYFPYTSDDGFSISDYRQVRDSLGTWTDVENIASEYHLMTDLVLNHCSSHHEWFLKFLQNEEPYNDYFITDDINADYSAVVRPRPHFILSEYATAGGKKHVWTTFSKDQVDLNFSNPHVLFEMLDTMLEYVLVHGSRIIRLDAIAYLWKERGTSCIHHHKTHLVVQLMRALLDLLAPGTTIITETNVPHEENISYFGDGNEAHLVYQFPLPPLLLYSMITESSLHLCNWARQLPPSTDEMSYFNFCASHDGIGVSPTYGILNDQERNTMIEVVQKRGGLVSYRATPKGNIPYELNINYLSAIAPSELPSKERAKIFLISQAIFLAMPGVPGIYIHSLLGSENWNHGVKITGQNRTINRQSLCYETVVDEIATEGSLRNLIFHGYLSLLNARAKSIAFHPSSPMQVLEMQDGIFAIIRGSDALKEKVLCIANITSREIVQEFDEHILPWKEGGEDIVNGDIVFAFHRKNSKQQHVIELPLESYEMVWLRFTL